MFVSVESVAVCCPGHGYCSESCKRWIRLGQNHIPLVCGRVFAQEKGKGGKGKGGKGKHGKCKHGKGKGDGDDDGLGPFAKVVEDCMDELRMCFARATAN